MNEIAKDTKTLNGLRREDRLAFGKTHSLLWDDPHAKDFIFLEYFIVESGLMWDTMLQILKKKPPVA